MFDAQYLLLLRGPNFLTRELQKLSMPIQLNGVLIQLLLLLTMTTVMYSLKQSLYYLTDCLTIYCLARVHC